MKLHAKVRIPFHREPFIALIEDGTAWRAPVANRAVIASEREPSDACPTVFARTGESPGRNAIPLPRELDYVGVGDIVRVNPMAQEVRVVYRRNSRHNGLLLTERCNSRCVMCSQPPRDIDDGYLVEELLQAIPLMSRETPELGFSGGEPTLLGPRLADLIRSAEEHLPQTALHVLSNGRLFRYLEVAARVAEVEHHDLVFGIPVYSDIASKHDFVVQAKGAFNETILGLLNLARMRIRVEIRVVIHRETYQRLPDIARFITRNLPFVEHVALMGLEFTGYARSNVEALWIDPRDYADELEAAVRALDEAGIAPRIYNLPHCLLPQALWPYACRSISDWKNAFPTKCQSCNAHRDCSGLFRSALHRFEQLVIPLH